MVKSKISLSIIIVSYNTSELTLKAVDSVVCDLLRSEVLKHSSQIIVVDNNSTDDSVSQLKLFAKKSVIPIQIIENSKNVGFAQANNQAIEKAQGEYFLLLNSDTYVQKGALEKLFVTMNPQANGDTGATTAEAEANSVVASHQGELDKLGILAASLVNTDGTPQPQGGDLPTLLSVTSQMTLLDDIPLLGRFLPSTQHTGGRTLPLVTQPSTTLIAKGWVAATAMLVHSQLVAEIGLLDQNIFMYGEDVEFCIRAQSHHWDVAIHPQAKITHYQNKSGSSQKAILGEIKGYVYIWAKHKPWWQQPVLRVILVIGCLIRLLIFGTIKPDTKRAKAYLHAMRYLVNT